MATSLQTANYGFGKYAPNDVTSYLTDYNGAMDKIDGAIKGVSDVANEAKATGDSNLNTIASLSLGLTATNNNVENLGKTQTAQGVEISTLEEKVNNINLGNFKEITFTSSIGATSLRGRLRALGSGVQGLVSGYLSANTLSPSKTVDDNEKFYELGIVSGNILNLKNGYLKQQGFMIVFSNSEDFVVSDFIIATCFFDTETNTTRFGLVTSETSVNWKGGNFRATF